MPSSHFSLEQVARARRFATGIDTDANRARIEKMAAGFESELASTESPQDQLSAASTSADAAPDDAAAGLPQTGGSDATSSAPASTDQDPMRD